MRQSHASCASLSPRLTRWLCRAAAALARAGKRAPGVSGSRGREIWRSRELESNYQVTPGAVTLSLCQLLSAAGAVLVTCPRLAPDPNLAHHQGPLGCRARTPNQPAWLQGCRHQGAEAPFHPSGCGLRTFPP